MKLTVDKQQQDAQINNGFILNSQTNKIIRGQTHRSCSCSSSRFSKSFSPSYTCSDLHTNTHTQQKNWHTNTHSECVQCVMWVGWREKSLVGFQALQWNLSVGCSRCSQVLGSPEGETGGQTGYLRSGLCSGSCWSPLESLDWILSEDETQRRSQWETHASPWSSKTKVRGQPHLDYTWMGPGSTDLQRHNMRTQNYYDLLFLSSCLCVFISSVFTLVLCLFVCFYTDLISSLFLWSLECDGCDLPSNTRMWWPQLMSVLFLFTQQSFVIVPHTDILDPSRKLSRAINKRQSEAASDFCSNRRRTP